MIKLLLLLAGRELLVRYRLRSPATGRPTVVTACII